MHSRPSDNQALDHPRGLEKTSSCLFSIQPSITAGRDLGPSTALGNLPGTETQQEPDPGRRY